MERLMKRFRDARKAYSLINLLNDSNDQFARRYARHLVLPEIGEEGQRKLLASSALVIGVQAGLAVCSAGLYVPAAGRRAVSALLSRTASSFPTCSGKYCSRTADIGRPKVPKQRRDRRLEMNSTKTVRSNYFLSGLPSENARAALIRRFRYRRWTAAIISKRDSRWPMPVCMKKSRWYRRRFPASQRSFPPSNRISAQRIRATAAWCLSCRSTK